MIKLTFCLRRRADLSRDEFQEYWRTTHAPLVAERAGTLGVLRYVQSHTGDLPDLHAAFRARNGGSPEPYDGVAELWFDGPEVLGVDDEARRSAAEELLADERNFIDLPRSPIFLVDEHEVVAPPQASASPILGCRDVDAAADHWVDVLGFECGPGGRFRPVEDEGTVYAIVRRDGCAVHLQIRRREVFAGPRESIESDAYVYVDDADAVHDEVASRGAVVVRPLQDEPYGMRDFTVETPDGHRVVFGSPC